MKQSVILAGLVVLAVACSKNNERWSETTPTSGTIPPPPEPYNQNAPVESATMDAGTPMAPMGTGPATIPGTGRSSGRSGTGTPGDMGR